MERIRAFLGIEAAAFWMAALVHGGVLIAGYRHREATIAESVIAAVLTLGLAATFVQPRASRMTGLTVQTFALLGTLVGIFTMIVGVGPQSRFDVALHSGFVTLLIAGLILVARNRSVAAT